MREGLPQGFRACYAIITRKGDIYFLADTSVNIEPTAEDLVEIALCTAQTARRFDIEPQVALLSFSSFGSIAASAMRESAPGGRGCCTAPIRR